MKVGFSRQVATAKFRIAIGPPRTHEVVVVTLSIKNLAMGGLHSRVKSGSGDIFLDLLRGSYGLLPSLLRSSGMV